jgi:hypothetical protein
MGHLQTSPAQDGMSASLLKADIRANSQHVRYGPYADERIAAKADRFGIAVTT